MNAEQADSFVGLPYEEGAFGPHSFNCWGLLHYVQRWYFGVLLPVVPIGNAEKCHAMFKDKVEGGAWSLSAAPSHGDGALMRSGSRPHVGIYLDIDGGGILHALEGVGVVFTTLDQLNSQGFGRTKYYGFTNERKLSNSS